MLSAQPAREGLMQAYCANRPYFEAAYRAYPDIPRGWLEAVSFTNTHFCFLTDADYLCADDSASMPRAYGLMGLVADGKGCFRENLHTVSSLSGYPEEQILNDRRIHVLAYAAAVHRLAETLSVRRDDPLAYAEVLRQLSELPEASEKDAFPMDVMLYSVYGFLNDAARAEAFGFPKRHIDMKGLLGEEWERLSAKTLHVVRGGDYSGAVWKPAPDCNFSQRSSAISGVVIHYTQGSYAGCIAWFLNCDSHVSAHYVLRSSDGQVTQMVREADKAWHARSANDYTIGIEHEAYGDIASYFTKAMYDASTELVRDICRRHPAINPHHVFYADTLDDGTVLNSGLHDLGGPEACVQIRGHQHYPSQSHTDPGPYWDWNYYYKRINLDTPVEVMEGVGGSIDGTGYGNDERRVVLLRAPEEATITVDFQAFDVEKDHDFLWVYDGEDVFAPKIGRWNTQSPGKLTSSGNTLCIEFRSDCTGTREGWRATWKANGVQPPSQGVLVNAKEGYILMDMGESRYYDAAVYDVNGRRATPVVRFVRTKRIDIGRLASGTYVLRYGEAARMNETVKFVK
ncbi:N-acetylmuramoyl-L-alanine amidase [Porphyromonas loveana]|uniref:N-acetylmuramoyl-L-alanine amidase n=1 Tax=Porphyromonas loveana TaxID=1884669 RepID=UPI00359FC79F